MVEARTPAKAGSLARRRSMQCNRRRCCRAMCSASDGPSRRAKAYRLSSRNRIHSKSMNYGAWPPEALVLAISVETG